MRRLTDPRVEWALCQALRWRDHHAQRESRMLAELATLVRASGGPLDRLDFSHASLVPLWEWFVPFVQAGSPGVPRTARPSLWDPSDPDDGRSEELYVASYLGQALGHYLRLVAARFYPPAEWTVLIDPDYVHHLHVGYVAGIGPFVAEGHADISRHILEPGLRSQPWVQRLLRPDGLQFAVPPRVPERKVTGAVRALTELPDVDISPWGPGRLAILGSDDEAFPDLSGLAVTLDYRPGDRKTRLSDRLELFVEDAVRWGGPLRSWRCDFFEVGKGLGQRSFRMTFHERIPHRHDAVIEELIRELGSVRRVRGVWRDGAHVVWVDAPRVSAWALGLAAHRWLEERLPPHLT